jgi:flagellar basal body-associated protein FliL
MVSVFGSLTHSDLNSTFSLLYKSKVSLSTVLLTLIVVTLIAIGADVWAAFVQNSATHGRIVGIIIIVIEIVLKVLLMAMLGALKFRGEKTTENDFNQSQQKQPQMAVLSLMLAFIPNTELDELQLEQNGADARVSDQSEVLKRGLQALPFSSLRGAEDDSNTQGSIWSLSMSR